MNKTKRYRNKYDTIAEVLQALRDKGTMTKTNIMFSARTSWTEFLHHLEVLINNNLIEQISNGEYRITHIGIQYLTAFEEVKRYVKE